MYIVTFGRYKKTATIRPTHPVTNPAMKKSPLPRRPGMRISFAAGTRLDDGYVGSRTITQMQRLSDKDILQALVKKGIQATPPSLFARGADTLADLVLD